MSQAGQDAVASLAEQNKQIVRRLYEEVFSRGELSLADELVQADARDLHDPQDRRGPERVKEVVRMLASAFPDQRWEIEDLIAEGDQVAMRSTWMGTHEGAFMGIPATGRRASVRHMYLFRLSNRKVVEYAAVRDDLSMMRQLDQIPTPGPPG